MVAPKNQNLIEDEFLDRVTDIAYQALLRQGLRGSFLDVQLDLWASIRSAYDAKRAVAVPAGEAR